MRVMLFGGPIIQREVIALLRTRKAFWLLLVSVALSILFSLLAWPSRATRAIAAQENMAVLMTFLLLQLFLALITIPAFTAGAISGEREKDTYDLLHSTLLPPHSIVLAKMLASVGYVLILLFASSPAICLLYLLGGIEFAVILKCYAVTFAAVVASGLACLAQSMRSARTTQAAVRGVRAVILWNGGLLLLLVLVYWLLYALTRGDFQRGFDSWIDTRYFMALCPFPVVSNEILQSGFGMGGGPADLWLYSVAWSSAYGLLHYLYLLRRVRRPDWAPQAAVGRLFGSRSAGPRPIRRTHFTNFLISLGENGAPLLENPVFLKELKSEFYSRPRYRIVLFWGTALILAAIGVAMSMSGGGIKGWVVAITFIPIIFILLLMPATGGSALPKEIEQGNLDFLRGTLLPMRRVVMGKYLASIYGLWGIPAAGGFMLLLIALPTALYSGSLHLNGNFSGGGSDPSIFWILLVWAVLTGLTLLLAAAIATLASVMTRRSMGGLLLAFLGTAGVFLFWPMLYMMVATRASTEPVPLMVTHPLLAFIFSIGIEGSSRNGLGPEATLFTFAIIYTLATALLLVIATSIAEQHRSRDR